MNKSFQTVLIAAGLLGLATLWRACGIADAKREVQLIERTRALADSARLTDSLLLVQARRDSISARTIARLAARVGSIHAQIDTVILPPPRDSVDARRDSVIESQKAIIGAQDTVLTLQRAMLASRDTLIDRLRGERDGFRAEARAWQHQAQPNILTKLVRGLPYIAAGVIFERTIH
jgi:hypothetical protein